MDEARFWSMIEAAWGDTGEVARERLAFLVEPSYELQPSYDGLRVFIECLSVRLNQLDEGDLVAFDRILERRLIELDREEIHEYTDGSDDGFLYCRGFIVAMGRDYCEAVSNNPSLGVLDAELEEMCYLPVHIHEERFGEFPGSGLSRETASNEGGWLD
jgi:hypothetical protein